MEETDWAYIAGFIDGEGYIDIFPHSTPQYRRTIRRGYTWEHKLYLSGCSLRTLKTIQEKLGAGKIFLHKRLERNYALYTLRFSHNEQRKIYPKIIPYLQTKKNLAIVALRSLNLRVTHPNFEDRELEHYRIDVEFERQKANSVIRYRNLSPHRKAILRWEKAKLEQAEKEEEK